MRIASDRVFLGGGFIKSNLNFNFLHLKFCDNHNSHRVCRVNNFVSIEQQAASCVQSETGRSRRLQ